jgi:predicted ATPase
LDLPKPLPDSLDRRQRELELQVALGGALAVAKGQAAADTGRAFARARELCDSLPERPQLMPVLYGQYVHHSSRGEMYRSLAITDELLQEAKGRDSQADLSLGYRAFGTTLLLSGKLGDARIHLEQALALGRPGEEQRLTQAYIFAPHAVALAYLATSLLALGYFEQARARITEALLEARRLSHPITSAVVLGRACIVNRYISGHRTFEEAAEALCSLAAEQGFLNWQGQADVELGWAMVASGQAEAGFARMRKGLAAVRAVEQQFDLPRYLGLFADAHRLAG